MINYLMMIVIVDSIIWRIEFVVIDKISCWIYW